MKKIFILNSDFGVSNTIGSRAYYVIKEVDSKNSIVFCRDYNKKFKNDYNLIKVIPKGEYLMKGLTFFQAYVSSKLPYGKIRNFFFEYFLIQKLKKIDLSDVDIIHSWDFLPKVYEYIKSRNPKIIIFQDVAIAFPTILENLPDKSYFTPKQLKIEDFVLKSLNYCDFYIVPSDFVKNSLLFTGIKENNIFKIPFGVDDEKFKPLKNKKFNGKFKVAFSGNINNRKGIFYLISAWKELNLKNAELNIYGRVYLETKNILTDLKKYNINLHGFIDLSKELPKNHIFLFPSLLEGSAKSVYEALASGLPVITTFNSGSIVEDKKTGFIIPVQNISEIKEKILYFYENRKEIEKMSINARNLAKKFPWGVYGRKINKLYKTILNKDGK